MSSDRIETKIDLEMKDKGPQSTAAFTGVSLRDYFAAHALMGMLADPEGGGPDGYALYAYKYADAMLKAREAKQ